MFCNCRHVASDRCKVIVIHFSNGASIEAKNRTGAMVWDYAIESSDDALLTALVQVYKQTKGISEIGQHMFKGTVYILVLAFTLKLYVHTIACDNCSVTVRYRSQQRNKATIECRQITNASCNKNG